MSEMSLEEVSFLLLLCLSAAADQQGTTVKPGDDATLQCHCPSHAAITLLEWTRQEHNPDRYVFFYRNNQLIEEYQLQSYRGRVELRDPEMKDGDVSVTLKNVTVNDAGIYNCTITISKTENGERTTTVFSSIFSLTVTDSGLSAPLAEGNKDEGNKDEGSKGEGYKDEGDKDEGDNGGGKEDGRKSQEPVTLVLGTVFGFLLSMSVVIFIIIIRARTLKRACVYHQPPPPEDIQMVLRNGRGIITD
ncbi:uncharacterized protein LOC133949662 [Platichthys flesus]|uniref:uncharacterized protein LOC133949662 n=1 Tax=Platichthys flesus TaxID=8260 RepID=UPI002DB5AC04|nr:uncharacterized protein LOC133949662 [Platichthys flesus]